MEKASLSATLFTLINILAICSTQTNNESIPYDSIYDYKDSSLTYKKIHKCVCGGNEVLYNGECRKGNVTITGLVDYSTTRIINIEEVEEIYVAEVICRKNYLNLSLPGESFALQSSGKLFNTNYALNLEFSQYCVEHILNEYGEIDMEVHLCLPIQTVPKCCPNNLYEPYSNCSNVNDTKVAVSFTLGKRSFQMQTKTFSNYLKCKEDENRTLVSISAESQSSHLKLTNEGLILQHTASIFGDMMVVPSPEYCIEFNIEEKLATRASYCYKNPFVVHQRTCKERTCVRKCCSRNEVFDMINMKCAAVDVSERWNPEFYDSKSGEMMDKKPDFKLVVGLPLNCEFFGLSTNNDPPDSYRLLSNGLLYVENWNMTLEAYQYCIDNFQYRSEILQEALVCFLDKSEPNSVGCESVGGVIYPALLLISCIFLGVTLVVYAIIPEFHVKIQGKCLIASVSSLLSAYISLVIVQLASTQLSDGGCITFGLLTQFSFLASFFWLNVMSFDIWRTLRSVQTGGKNSPASARRRYLKYSLYAWGCPLIIVLVTMIMQFLPKNVDKTNLIVPEIGVERCFFPIYDTRALWIYFYGYISIILVVNSFFFIHLAVLLFRARKVSESALGKKTRLHKEWAKLYLKLFLIMGITWIFEVTSWVHGMCGFWLVTDIINTLRGLLIFVIFVCKRDVIKKLLTESSPAFHRMRNTMLSTSVFSRNSKRTSSLYVDPTTSGANEANSGRNHADAKL